MKNIFNFNLITPKIAIIFTVGLYIFLACLWSLPFLVFANFNFIDALLQGTSCLTGTGAIFHGEMSNGLILWRSLGCWFGGILFILLFVAILPRVIASPIYVFNMNLSATTNWRLLPDLTKLCKKLFLIYCSFTIFVFVGLAIFGIDVFSAFNYSLAIVSTSKFIVGGDVNDFAKIFMALAMLAAGLNYAVCFSVLQSGIKKVMQDAEIFCYFLLTTAAVILLCGDLGFSDAFCQVCSFVSSSGTNFVHKNPAFCQIILAGLLLLGGCAGSASGGLKICRFVLIFKQLVADIKAVFHPNIISSVNYNGKRVADNVLKKVIFFFCLYLLTIVGVALCLAICDLPFDEAIFAGLSCVANCGGFLPENILQISNFGKLIMMLGMLLGRLELFMIFLLFLPEFWQSRGKW